MNRRNFIIEGAAFMALTPAVILAGHSSTDQDVVSVSSHWPNGSEWTMLNAINIYRKENGRGRLEMSRSLAAAARHHAWYMSLTDDVDHSLDVSWSQNIYNYGYPQSTHIGENAAAGRSSAANTLQQWKDSPSHNANLLVRDYIRAGVGRVYNPEGRYKYYWCLTLGNVSHRTIYN